LRVGTISAFASQNVTVGAKISKGIINLQTYHAAITIGPFSIFPRAGKAFCIKESGLREMGRELAMAVWRIGGAWDPHLRIQP